MNFADVDPVAMIPVAGGGALLRGVDVTMTYGLARPAGVVFRARVEWTDTQRWTRLARPQVRTAVRLSRRG